MPCSSLPGVARSDSGVCGELGRRQHPLGFANGEEKSMLHDLGFALDLKASMGKGMVDSWCLYIVWPPRALPSSAMAVPRKKKYCTFCNLPPGTFPLI